MDKITTPEHLAKYYDDMRRKIKSLTKSQNQDGATMENRSVYLYKKIMKYGKDAIDEIQTLEEAKEVITLMAAHDTLRFMELRSFERTLDLSGECETTVYFPRRTEK